MNIQQVKQRFGIIGNNSALNRAIEVAIQVAPTDLSVLISGESGTGKENFPQIVHQYSARKHGQYIAVNCGAIPEGTIDSELFGHEKGSFTGATESRKGYFEEANGGTIFLDEVAELPLSTQVRLLRVLETGEYLKVGSSKTQKTNVRVVAATNVNMMEVVSNGKFREDLFYRLNTVPIIIPPLRNRKEDIHLLFRKFASDFADKYRMPPIELTDDARHLLESYSWPGNVRQLKNITEQISIIEQNRLINASALQNYLPASNVSFLPARLKTTDERTFSSEREILYQVLFDMKKDVNELKRLVNTLMQYVPGDVAMPAGTDTVFERIINPDNNKIELTPETAHVTGYATNDIGIQNIQDTEEIIEESLSLTEKEIEFIKKALEKHKGKRKLAADELGISERTLYRKIKEHNLE